MTRIWVDVEHLFHHAEACPRPSGIQRLSFEIYQALVERFGTDGPIRFVRGRFVRGQFERGEAVRGDPGGGGFAAVPWDEVAGLYERMVAGPAGVADADAVGAPPPAPPPVPPEPSRGPARRLLHRASNLLPGHVRAPVAAAVGLQLDSWREAASAVRAAIRGPAEPATGSAEDATAAAEPAVPAAPPDAFAGVQTDGDVLLSIGAPWWQDDYVELVTEARRRHGLRLALLVYDLIPVRAPEWCDPHLVAIFGAWLGGILPQCDAVLAISRATAEDVQRYAAERRIAVPVAVRVIPIGTGFSAPATAPLASGPASRALPAPGSYALFVSTIEGRKNHALLVRVWRRLLAESPGARVPTLVFAGRIGSLVRDLLQQLDNTDWLDRRVMVVEDPSDAELEALYQGCLFTLFPSFAEGWGLPVTESLAFGKPCVIADSSSLPEAGGPLARYFDPDDVNDAHRVIRDVIQDPEALAAWTARVRREFRPVPWAATAESLVRALAPGLLEAAAAE